MRFPEFLGAQNLPSDLRHQIFMGRPESAIRFTGVPESSIRFSRGVLSLASELLTDLKYSHTLVSKGLQGNKKITAKMMVKSNKV